jgi:hypothetical protein
VIISGLCLVLWIMVCGCGCADTAGLSSFSTVIAPVGPGEAVFVVFRLCVVGRGWW